MKVSSILIATVLSVSTAFSSPAQSTPEQTVKVKELNFVFLHGLGDNSASFQLLEDSILEQLPAYARSYEQDYPDIKVKANTLKRNYPNDVDIDAWADNITDSIAKHLPNKKNLILIGHSMGGKTGLYAVARNKGDLASKVAMVVTINSPIKSLQNYYYVGGEPAVNYWQTKWLISNRGAVNSIVYYDSSQDGQLVGQNKHWLAFISGESTPLSNQFDVSGVDPLPRDMDDVIVPVSAQYSDGADVVYCGEYGHNDFTTLENVARFMADQILRYLFGGNIECSVLGREGAFGHKADLLPGTDHWEDLVGGVLTGSGTLEHRNYSYIKWQEWDDVVGESSSGTRRSSYELSLGSHFPSLRDIKQSRWVSSNDPSDFRIYIRTSAPPRQTVQLNWSVYEQGLLPQGIQRERYEVEVETGTPLSNIGRISWATDDTRDLRLRIWSQAESPFRWFKVHWKVYFKEKRQRKVIDEIPSQA